MNHDPLPPELRQLEGQLARRPCPEPGVEFCARLLAAVSVEQPTPSRWRMASRAVIALMLLSNLGLSIGNGVRFQRLTALPPVEKRPAPADDGERFDSFAASALSNLTPGPDVGPLGRELFTLNGDRTWVTR